MTDALRWGGILAAGEGSRLRRDGWTVAKPLVPVGGVPLVEHAIENLLAAGVERLVVLFNERDQRCADFVHDRFRGRPVEAVLKTTASSLESFREVSSLLPPGRALFSTVDAWCPRDDFLRFARDAAGAHPEDTVLAVTPFVDDERPLWVRADMSGRVMEIGGAAGDAVTAGAYVFSPRARELAVLESLDRLRHFLRWLLEGGEPMTAVSIEKVVDVDRARDVALAEALAATPSGAPR